eukprot:IDg4048t1
MVVLQSIAAAALIVSAFGAHCRPRLRLLPSHHGSPLARSFALPGWFFEAVSVCRSRSPRSEAVVVVLAAVLQMVVAPEVSSTAAAE